MRANIGIDLDGVICDTYPEAFRLLKEMYPKNVTHGDETCNWEKDFNLTEQQVKDCFIEAGKRGMFREFPPYEDAKKTLRRLSYKYNIYIVTWRNYIPNAKNDTLYWLDSNKIPYYRLVLTRDKVRVALKERFAFFLDDTVTMCNRVAKTNVPTFLFNRPHNKDHIADALVKRIKSWEEVEKILLF